MNRIQRLVLIVSMILGMNVAKAQEGIDTAMVRIHGISKIWVYVKIPALPNRTERDSCKAEEYNYDTLCRLTYRNNAMNCYGWGTASESFFTYGKGNKPIQTKDIHDDIVSLSKYTYNAHGDVVKVVQTSPTSTDSMTTINKYTYNKQGLVARMVTTVMLAPDTVNYIYKYEYDTANNIKVIWTYTGDSQLIKKETYDITPISKKLLEFSVETKLPREQFTRGWNYYNEYALLYKTQYSNNTWTDFEYFENGLVARALSYNMQGKLNLIKTYYYKFYE